MGNWVPVNEVLQRYNDPDTYAAILIDACYTGKKPIIPKNIPIAMPVGNVGMYRTFFDLNSTQVLIPLSENSRPAPT